MGNIFDCELETVDYVDLKRYLGKWYEIAKIPSFFERGGQNTFAFYSSLSNGFISVTNQTEENGKIQSISGTAYPVDPSGSKLKVDFGLPSGPADYWIIRLDPNYTWAVVSNPDRDHLWILSRSKYMNENLYQSILESICDDIDISRIVKTPQF